MDNLNVLLGAGGPISKGLAEVLLARGRRVRLVSRSGHRMPGCEVARADLLDPQAVRDAVSPGSTVFLLAGLPYRIDVWTQQWPRIMDNALAACAAAGARLVFFDNVYMYGKVHGTMTEETPFNPCSRKGEIRARIATSLIDEWKKGALTAMIARSADFYGPETVNSVSNMLVFRPLAVGKKASWLVNDTVPHSFTYTRDAAASLVELAGRESAWNQTWHVPTTGNPPTGREFVAMAARALGVAPTHRVLSRPVLKVAGMFDAVVRESYEMLYQSDSPYLFDSSKYAREFGFGGTSYEKAIQVTAEGFRESGVLR